MTSDYSKAEPVFPDMSKGVYRGKNIESVYKIPGHEDAFLMFLTSKDGSRDFRPEAFLGKGNHFIQIDRAFVNADNSIAVVRKSRPPLEPGKDFVIAFFDDFIGTGKVVVGRRKGFQLLLELQSYIERDNFDPITHELRALTGVLKTYQSATSNQSLLSEFQQRFENKEFIFT